MINHFIALPSTLCRGLRGLVCLNVLIFSASQTSALPRGEVDPPPGLLMIQDGPSSAEQQAHEVRQAQFADLHEVLRASRVKLEELTKATARVAADTKRHVAADTKRHKEMQALEKDNERLTAELERARAYQASLEGSRELAEARIAELTKSLEAARRESTRVDEALGALRGQNERLGARLTRADAARSAALDEVKQAEAELVSRREELELNQRKLAEANGAREQIEARVIAMEKRVNRAGAEAERLRTGLAEAKEQLKQAAVAAVQAERTREAAHHEADRLQSEAEDARKASIAATTESARLQIANAELERQLHSLRRDFTSATAAARQNLIAMEEKIEDLNAALDSARPEEAGPTQAPEAKPDAVEEEPAATMPQAPSAMAQPPAPGPARAPKPSIARPAVAEIEGAPVKAANAELQRLVDSLVANSTAATRAARPDPITKEEAIEEVDLALAVSRSEEAAPPRGPKVKSEAVQERRDLAVSQAPLGIARSPAPGSVTQIRGDDLAGSAAIAEPNGSPLIESGLALFNANLQTLNELELDAAGSAIFSGVESTNGPEVRVSTTAAWDSVPPPGRESYLGFLLDYWVAARGGKGPAVVRIVDSRGQVLVEKSWP